MAEFKLSYSARDIDKKLGEIDKLTNLIGDTPVAD
jgi:hypothetical protein